MESFFSTSLAFVKELGLPTVLCVCLIYYVMKENIKREKSSENRERQHLELAEKREEKLNKIIEGHLLTLNNLLMQHDNKVSSSLESLREANKFQREEHIEILKTLNAIKESCRVTEAHIEHLNNGK